MTDHKELIELLRRQSQVDYALEQRERAKMLDEDANAIEEQLKQAQAKCEEIEAALDTEIEYGNELKRKINSLKHDGYYTGTYIKALMEMEE